MPICNFFDGGFMRPVNINPKSIESNKTSKVVKTYSLDQDNTTYISGLRPIILDQREINHLDSENPRLIVYLDSTTPWFQGGPRFIEPSVDDYQPLLGIEYPEAGRLTVGSSHSAQEIGHQNIQPETPHFIYKEVGGGVAGSYLGRDRFDNYMTEVLRDFGGKFNWYSGDRNAASAPNTFGHGDLCATPTGLSLCFNSIYGPDATAFSATLWHSRFVDSDGTFGNPVMVEENINALNGVSLRNTKNNPKMIYVDKLGLLIGYVKLGQINLNFGNDAFDYFIHFKLSKDNGVTWSDYSEVRIPFNSYSNSISGIIHGSITFPINFNMVYAENKIVCFCGFTTNTEESNTPTRSGTVFYSEDLGRTFKTSEIDFNILIQRFLTGQTWTIKDSCLTYDPKNSKFFVFNMVRLSPTGSNRYSPTVMIVMNNLFNELKNWDVCLMQNMSATNVIGDGATDNIPTYAFSLADRVATGYPTTNFLQRLVPFTDSNNITYLIANGGMMYRNTNVDLSTNSFDEYADFSVSNQLGKFSWIPNPFMIPIEMKKVTDSYLSQFKFANSPWRARKLIGPSHGHKRTFSGRRYNLSSLSHHYDSIIGDYSEVQYNDTTALDWQYPRNNFFIVAATEYKNSYFMLGMKIVQGIVPSGASTINDCIDYHIPVLIHRPGWSNLNIKPRKINYLTPARYPDSTYVGWEADAGAPTSNTVRTIFPTKKYWEIQFMRADAAALGSFGCDLKHQGNTANTFKGNRGCQHDVDSTRGMFSHFICSLDSVFYRDITSMVHYSCLAQTAVGNTNKTGVQILLGKDHIGIRSSGSVDQNMYRAIAGWDATRNIEFLVTLNRFRTLDETHAHRVFAKYENNRDWTMLYYNLCTAGTAAFIADTGIKIGNMWRWPSSIVGDATSVVFFKYHSEGWSSLGMNTLITGSLLGTRTDAVLPQPCLPTDTYLPNGARIAWSGNDATANTVFEFNSLQQKNSPKKLMDIRPSISWESYDATTPQVITIDFGQNVAFNSVALYNHNINGMKLHYAPSQDNTPMIPDYTAFMIYRYDQALTEDTTSQGFFVDFLSSIVDRNTLLVYDSNFLSYVRNRGIVGKDLYIYSDNYGYYLSMRCTACQWFDDASAMMTFKFFDKDYFGVMTGNRFFESGMLIGENVYVQENKHLFVLPKTIVARHILIDMTSADILPGSSPAGIASANRDPPYDGFARIGSISFGVFEEAENPLQNGFSYTQRSPSVLQQKLSGRGMPIQLSNNKDIKAFNIQYSASEIGHRKQFGQIQNLLKNISVSKDVFYFIPQDLNIKKDPNNKGQLLESVLLNTYGIKKMTTDFYMVRVSSSNVNLKRDGLLGSVSLNLEEVL